MSEQRHSKSAPVACASQLPVKAWHTYLNDPTLADAILDRVVHSSHKIELKGTKSMRDGDSAADL